MPRSSHQPLIPTRLSPLLGIYLTVFLDLVSFGMFIPDIQLRGERLASLYLGLPLGGPTKDPRVGFMVGGLLAAYSLAQLIAAPYLGRLSDRSGRRKVLLVTTVLAAASYLMYAFATSYPMILGARVLAGLSAANLGVAFAYVSDVTEPQERSKGFGGVGAALGLGFILGPPIGSLLIRLGNDDPRLLSFVGAVLVVVNFFYILLFLPGTEPKDVRQEKFFEMVKVAVSTPGLALLLAMFFAFNLGFANLQSTFFLLLADSRSVFHLSTEGAKATGGLIMGLVGFVGAIMQGVVVPRLNRVHGELKLLRGGFFLLVPALAIIPFAPLVAPAIAAIVFLGIGSGLSQPSLSALVSRSAPGRIQGGIFGLTQALGALARLIGPVVSVPLFSVAPYWPYLLGAAIVCFPAVAAWRVAMPRLEKEFA